MAGPAGTRRVALLAEGVGRNVGQVGGGVLVQVALLAEGVGRNNDECGNTGGRRVALLAEGVGRNPAVVPLLSTVIGRPPRGGRG